MPRPVNPLDVFSSDQLRERASLKWSAYDADVLPVWVAEMDTPLAEPIARALQEAIELGDTGYAGPGQLPDAFAQFALRRYGWKVDPVAMRLVADVLAGLREALALYTEPGARVVVNTPAYPPFFYWIGKLNRAIVECPLGAGPDGYHLDLAALERAFAAGAAAFLLCSPHNPTGTVFDREELLAVAELADRYQVRVIADEIHAPLTYPGVVHTPFGMLDHPAAARAITLVSASKAWNLPGLKAALMVGGQETIRQLSGLDDEVSYSAGLFGVIAGAVAFTAGEPWLADLMAALDANRRRLADLLTAHLPEVGYRQPDATFLAWLDCRTLGLGDDPAERFRTAGRVALSSGPTFGTPGTGFARFNFACGPAVLEQAVDRMAAAIAT